MFFRLNCGILKMEVRVEIVSGSTKDLYLLWRICKVPYNNLGRVFYETNGYGLSG